MKISLSFLLFSLPFILRAQTEAQTPGIRFENLSGWQAVKERAKQENKYIFVDCYATWCGPCKLMDKNVYTVDSIGKFINESFVSVKVQIDSTAKDNEQAKAWYTDARYIQQEYKITAFPTFLFLTPDGKLVHKDLGYLNPSAFNSLARNALDPQKQYYTLVENFNQGKLPYTDMFTLALAARNFRDASIADAVAKSYINNYLLNLKDNELYTRQNIGFMGDFTKSSKDKAFKIFYTQAVRVDTTVHFKNYAQSVVDIIIEREEINSRLYKDGKLFQSLTDNPDWAEIRNGIKKKYNADYADRVVLWSKILWLEHKKDWPEYCKNVILKVEKYGPYCKFAPYADMSADSRLNYSAWEIFSYSTDTAQLEEALEWSKKTVNGDKRPTGALVEYLDTYANILHKLGRTDEAINAEEKAFYLSPQEADIKETLSKFKKREPTWPKL